MDLPSRGARRRRIDPPPPLAWRRPLGRKLPLVLFVLACLLSCVVVVVAWSPGHGVTIQHSEEMT
jgi:hypothetical protein